MKNKVFFQEKKDLSLEKINNMRELTLPELKEVSGAAWHGHIGHPRDWFYIHW